MAKSAWPDWKVYKRDQCECTYCGLGGRDFHVWRQLTIDHLIPTSKGGSNEPKNKVVSCTRCNTLKGGFNPSAGEKIVTPSDDQRTRFIENVKRYLDLEHSEEEKIST